MRKSLYEIDFFCNSEFWHLRFLFLITFYRILWYHFSLSISFESTLDKETKWAGLIFAGVTLTRSDNSIRCVLAHTSSSFGQKWHFCMVSTCVGWTDRPTAGPTNQRTNGRMDIPSYRDLRPHLNIMKFDIFGRIHVYLLFCTWFRIKQIFNINQIESIVIVSPSDKNLSKRAKRAADSNHLIVRNEPKSESIMDAFLQSTAMLAF